MKIDSLSRVLALLCVLASLLVPGITSANMASGAENRVWAFDLADGVRVGVERSLTPALHQGCELAQYDCASGSLPATRGGGGGEFSRGGPPREPGTGNYLPDPDATGPHTTLGTHVGSDGKPYTQGATFDKDGNFLGRTDVTDHGRADHTNPHFHPATGPNSAKSPAQAPLSGDDPRVQPNG